LNIANDHFLLIGLVLLIFLSAFFSAAETGTMFLNRYRLRHWVRKKNHAAIRVDKLLQRPDRLLGVVLIGNTFANIMASSVATMLLLRYFGQVGVLYSSVILTFVILIFSETAPKTFAALYPQRVAFASSRPLMWLLKVLYPLVWAVNVMANAVLRVFGIKVHKRDKEPLTVEELRTVVFEAEGLISHNYHQMLLRILNLEQVEIEEAMTPRSEIYGIDLSQEWPIILEQVVNCKHQYVPLYFEDINNVKGMLSLRHALGLLSRHQLTKETLRELATEVYFIPEGTLLNHQLLNFQRTKTHVGLVIDEYGDIIGLVTLNDILEEIVGEFATDIDQMRGMVEKQQDGSYRVDAGIGLRDLERMMSWGLSTQGPRTLSGLIIEQLESMPKVGICLRLQGYPIEILEVDDTTVKTIRLWPKLKHPRE